MNLSVTLKRFCQRGLSIYTLQWYKNVYILVNNRTIKDKEIYKKKNHIIILFISECYKRIWIFFYKRNQYIQDDKKYTQEDFFIQERDKE